MPVTRVSFGIYLLHWPMLEIVAHLPIHSAGAATLLVLTSTLVLAALSHRLLEEPAQRYFRHRSRSGDPRHSAQAVIAPSTGSTAPFT